jgi:mannosyltransferase
MPLTFPWPIILFHPGDYDNPDDRNSLKAGLLDKIGYEADALAFLTRIEFERLYWKLPAGIPSDVDALDPIYRHVWPGS